MNRQFRLNTLNLSLWINIQRSRAEGLRILVRVLKIYVIGYRILVQGNKILIEGIDTFTQIACDHAKWAGLDFPDCSYCGQFSFNKSSAEPRIFSLKLLTFTKAVDFRNKVKSPPKKNKEIMWGLLTWKRTHKVHIVLAWYQTLLYSRFKNFERSLKLINAAD